MKNWKGILARLLISVGAIGFILYSFRSKLSEALTILKTEVRWEYFLIAVLTYLAGLGLLAVRLNVMLKVHRIILSFWESFYLGLVGLFFNLFLPSSVGGDVVKIYYAAKHSPGKKIQATTSIIMDRLMGFVALAILTMAAFAFYSRQNHDAHIDKVIYLFLGGIFLMAFFFLSPKSTEFFIIFGRILPLKLREKLAVLVDALYQFKLHFKSMSVGVLISLATQALFIIVYYWLTVSLSVDIPVLTFFIIIPILTVISMAPSLGGLGVREAGVMYLFSKYMPHERALALSLLLDMLIYGFSIASGIIYSIRGGLKSTEVLPTGDTHESKF